MSRMLPAHPIDFFQTEDSLRIVALEHRIRDLQARIVQLDHDFKSKLITPSPPSPADTPAVVLDKITHCLASL